MSLFHVLTSPVADFTGTVTVFNSAGGTQTANATEIVRPSDWNSAHAQTITLTGNTAGNSTVGGTNIVWSGGNNVTLSGNGSTIVVSAGGAGTAGPDGGNVIAAGGSTANSTGTIVFSNSNGVSFGLNGATVTATVKTDYLTTARASNDAIGLNTALTAGPLAWTVNSSGISLNAGSAAGTTSGFAGNLISGSMTHDSAGLNLSLNHPAWLTTAALSNHSHGNPTLALTNLSGTTASASNGLTLSLSAAAPGAGAGFSGGMSNLGNTAGTSGTVASQLVLVGSNNVTLSQSVNGNSGTITINAGGAAMSDWAFNPMTTFNRAISHSRFYGQETYIPNVLHVSYFAVNIGGSSPISITSSNAGTSRTGSASTTFICGIYQRNSTNSSQYDSVATTSWTAAFSASVTVSSSSISCSAGYSWNGSNNGTATTFSTNSGNFTNVTWSGVKTAGGAAAVMHVPFSTTLQPGNYFIGLGVSTSVSGGGAPMTISGDAQFSILGGRMMNDIFGGMLILGANTNASVTAQGANQLGGVIDSASFASFGIGKVSNNSGLIPGIRLHAYGTT